MYLYICSVFHCYDGVQNYIVVSLIEYAIKSCVRDYIENDCNDLKRRISAFCC